MLFETVGIPARTPSDVQMAAETVLTNTEAFVSYLNWLRSPEEGFRIREAGIHSVNIREASSFAIQGE